MSIRENSADMSIRLPELPRLVLRVGFAGSQRLPEDARQKLGARLDEVLEKLGFVSQKSVQVHQFRPKIVAKLRRSTTVACRLYYG